MSKSQFQTPVLLITFRRPNLTGRVINSISKVKPSRFYVACDGPRENVPGEKALVEETRRVIANAVNWDCELNLRFSEENQGCAVGVSNAINWFFEHEEEGIILEDDCMPHPLFFDYCAVMLERYRGQPEIMHVGGVNYHSTSKISLGDYYYSRYGHIWGWATWKRAWQLYKLKISDDTTQINEIVNVLSTNRQKKFWFQIFTQQRDNPVDTWDYSWQYTILKNRGYCIYPSYTLVDNIGFGIDATHTAKAPKILPKSNNTYKPGHLFRANPFNSNWIQDYYDYINFLRAFKGRNIDLSSFGSFFKFLKEKYYD